MYITKTLQMIRHTLILARHSCWFITIMHYYIYKLPELQNVFVNKKQKINEGHFYTNRFFDGNIN